MNNLYIMILPICVSPLAVQQLSNLVGDLLHRNAVVHLAAPSTQLPQHLNELVRVQEVRHRCALLTQLQ